ncbi:hypothetical protein C8F01DRAFT_1243848 [Mycena amicta]|nr:hypothetical protein C8F01DRAFT_1243848 [Mycena amicta]
MIIDENTPKTPTDSESVTPFSARHEPAEPGLPPPYFSYQATPPPTTSSSPLLPRGKPLHHQRRRRRRRILVLVSLALNCLLVTLLLRARRPTEDNSVSRGDSEKTPARQIEAVTPDPHLGRCLRRAQWSNAMRPPTETGFVYESSAQFRFSDPTSLMFLVSRGAHASGRLDVMPSQDSLPHVILTARYHSLAVRDRVNVCWMERKLEASQSNGAGVGIFTPAPFDGQRPEDKIEVDVTLYLPTAARGKDSSLPLYNLETQLPSFAHNLNSLRGVIEFGQLHLESRNKPIVAESLFARNATILTSNAAISGTFDASAYLSLVTSNAPIDATVNLHSISIFQTTELVLHTRNAQLETAINLLTSAATGEGGKFTVSALTSDAPLVVSFPASPTHSTLHFNGYTSNSPANVWLNHAYEGDFALVSNMVLVDKRPFLDPQRLRSVFYGDWKNGMVSGNVRWKLPIFKSKTLGSVRVTTSNNILKLFV